MWILPKQLISRYAPGTVELTSDLNNASQTCGQLLTVRSKHLQWKIFLREWKKGIWMRLRCGVICEPSLGQSFLDWWISCLPVIHANHLATQETEKEQTIQGISGSTLQQEFLFSNQECVSLKMLKDTYRWDSPQSLVIWNQWVIEQRGDYLVRLNAEQHTIAKEFSFLPTPCANEDSFRLNGNSQQSKCLEARARRGELKTAGHVMSVDRLSLTVAHANIMNLNVLNAGNGHIHLCGVQKTDAQTVENHGRTGTTQQHGPLNPQFVEVMMGVPIGWTDCGSLGTE